MNKLEVGMYVRTNKGIFQIRNKIKNKEKANKFI